MYSLTHTRTHTALPLLSSLACARTHTALPLCERTHGFTLHCPSCPHWRAHELKHARIHTFTRSRIHTALPLLSSLESAHALTHALTLHTPPVLNRERAHTLIMHAHCTAPPVLIGVCIHSRTHAALSLMTHYLWPSPVFENQEFETTLCKAAHSHTHTHAHSLIQERGNSER